MKKILLITVIFLVGSTYVNAKQNCSDLADFKKVGKNSVEYINCLKKNGKFKLKTDSKLKSWITGKEKIKFPNPIKGIKKVGEALKPDIKLKN